MDPPCFFDGSSPALFALFRFFIDAISVSSAFLCSRFLFVLTVSSPSSEPIFDDKKWGEIKKKLGACYKNIPFEF